MVARSGRARNGRSWIGWRTATAPITPITGDDPHAPAERFALPDGTTFGIIASTTAPFCRACDRSRLTADGQWLLCLYAERGVDLREPLRAGASDAELTALLRDDVAAAHRSRCRGASGRLPSGSRCIR